jgi:hypothetical protein
MTGTENYFAANRSNRCESDYVSILFAAIRVIRGALCCLASFMKHRNQLYMMNSLACTVIGCCRSSSSFLIWFRP